MGQINASGHIKLNRNDTEILALVFWLWGIVWEARIPSVLAFMGASERLARDWFMLIGFPELGFWPVRQSAFKKGIKYRNVKKLNATLTLEKS